MVFQEDLYIVINGNIIFDWYGCGLDREFRDFAPSTMVVYTALLFGANNGQRYLDFMGAGSPSMKYGVRDFKAQFGGELCEFGRYRKTMNHLLYYIGILTIQVKSIVKR